jgi:hypothetical protein
LDDGAALGVTLAWVDFTFLEAATIGSGLDIPLLGLKNFTMLWHPLGAFFSLVDFLAGAIVTYTKIEAQRKKNRAT